MPKTTDKKSGKVVLPRETKDDKIAKLRMAIANIARVVNVDTADLPVNAMSPRVLLSVARQQNKGWNALAAIIVMELEKRKISTDTK